MNPNPKSRNRRRFKQRIVNYNLEKQFPPVVTMADQHTMAQLLQAPTEGYKDAIVVPVITANNFKLKHGLLTLVQNKQFYGHDKEDPHAHIRYFNKITSTLKFLNVPNTSIKLMLFPFSLEDSLNSAAGGNFLDKMPRECLSIIESLSKVHYSRDKPIVSKVSTNASTSGVSPDVAELKDMVKALLLDKKRSKPISCSHESSRGELCYLHGAHSYKNCPATNDNIYRDNIQEFVSQASAVNYNQGNTSYRPQMMSNQILPPGFPTAPAYQASAPQIQGVSKEYFSAYVKANDAVMKNMRTQGTLPSNTIANPKSYLKAITTRSGMAECLALADLGASINLMPFSMWKRLSLPHLTPVCMTLELVDRSISRPIGVAEDVYVKVGSFHFPTDFVVVDFDTDPRVPLILERSFLKTGRALIDVFEGELTLRVGKEAITFNLDQTSRYSANYSDMTAKRINVIDMSCEENSDFLLEEVDAFLVVEDEPTSSQFHQSYLDLEGDILLLEAFPNDDPSLPPLNQRNYMPEVFKELKIYEAKSGKSSVDEPPMVEFKDLPPHLDMHSWTVKTS
uniref:Reverse transcriptase domain-containing protein n=1 Tax=Tanacetum cinerariifolium TaxID=118510 RepID=A0A699J1K8_TANCI|nr:reverse transcriptase domain-containing protein [Tanacetum cinerariifolium]